MSAPSHSHPKIQVSSKGDILHLQSELRKAVGKFVAYKCSEAGSLQELTEKKEAATKIANQVINCYNRFAVD